MIDYESIRHDDGKGDKSLFIRTIDEIFSNTNITPEEHKQVLRKLLIGAHITVKDLEERNNFLERFRRQVKNLVLTQKDLEVRDIKRLFFHEFLEM